MKKVISWIIRIFLIIGIFLTASMTLSSKISLNTNTNGLVKHVINKAVKQSGDNNVQSGFALIQALGVEDALISKLPKKINLDTDMMSLYKFGDSYQSSGKLTVENLNLPNKTDEQQTINDLVLKLANNELDQNKEQINQGIKYYKIFFYVVIGLYILAALLVLFGKRLAIIPLLLASIASYSVISYIGGEIALNLQDLIYKGIKVDLASGFSTAIVLSIIISVIWLFCAKLGKDKPKIGRHAT